MKQDWLKMVQRQTFPQNHHKNNGIVFFILALCVYGRPFISGSLFDKYQVIPLELYVKF